MYTHPHTQTCIHETRIDIIKLVHNHAAAISKHPLPKHTHPQRTTHQQSPLSLCISLSLTHTHTHIHTLPHTPKANASHTSTIFSCSTHSQSLCVCVCVCVHVCVCVYESWGERRRGKE